MSSDFSCHPGGLRAASDLGISWDADEAQRVYAAWRAEDLPGRDWVRNSQAGSEQTSATAPYRLGHDRWTYRPPVSKQAGRASAPTAADLIADPAELGNKKGGSAPRQVRLMYMLVPTEDPDAARDAFIAAFERAIRNGCNLRVGIEVDASEPDPISVAETNAVWEAMTKNQQKELRTDVEQALESTHHCADCRGTGKYQPLLGPAEDCRTCASRGRI